MPSRLKSFFTKNLHLKLISLLLAILLELYFYFPDNHVTALISASVEIENIPASMMLVEPVDKEKDLAAVVKFRGPRPLVEQAKSTKREFSVKLNPGFGTSNAIFLTPDQINLPGGVDVVNIVPPRIDIKLDTVVKKELHVKANTIGSLAKGYRVSEIGLRPETVYARGPKGELKGVSEILTQEIDLSNLRENKNFEVLLDDNRLLTTYNLNLVRVFVKVEPIQVEESYDKVNVTVLAPENHAATVSPSSVKLTIGGNKDIVDELKANQIELIADGRSLGAGTHKLKVESKLPIGVSIIKTEPAEVKVTIVKGNG